MKLFKCNTCKKFTDYIYNEFKYHFYYKQGRKLTEHTGKCYTCHNK